MKTLARILAYTMTLLLSAVVICGLARLLLIILGL